MSRRLYFLFPDTTQTKNAVEHLESLGIETERMHTVARHDVDLSGLPVATDRQRRDRLGRLENGLWRGNLLVFGLAVLGLAAAGLTNHPLLALAAIAVMVATVAGGAWFAIRLPHVHLAEFSQAIHHGEILLMVDVSRNCVDDVEALMQNRHPEAVAGGSDWTPGLFGV
jgi:hypothetical protein